MIYLIELLGAFIGFFIGCWCNMETNKKQMDDQIKVGIIYHNHKLYKIMEEL